VPKSKKPSKKSVPKVKSKKHKKAGRKRDKAIPAGFRAQGDGFDALRDENDFLRAMLGKCLRCGSRSDDASLAQIHIEVVDGRLDERPAGPRFHGHVYIGGGFGAGGDTREEVIKNLRDAFARDLMREFERAVKHPTAGIAKNGYPDHPITPDFEAVKLLQELHVDMTDVVTALGRLQKHELWGGYGRIKALRDANEKLRREKGLDPHEAGISEESLVMLQEGIESVKVDELVKVDLDESIAPEALEAEAVQTEDE
jgi:hypothetical protein